MNASMNMNNFQECLQDDHMFESPALSVPFDAASSVISPDDPTLSPRVSPVSSLTPTGSIAKPVRRRSRASKKLPTTLLNANPDNFRSLVQKFTGCNSSSNLLGARKGPITLNFAQYNNHNNSVTDQQYPSSILHQHEHPNADYCSFSVNSNYMVEPFTASAIVPSGEAANSRPEQLTIDGDLDIMLQELSEPGIYPAGSSNSTDDFW